MIAYCGIVCDTCPIHVATLEQDGSKREIMRLEIARLCSAKYGMNLQPADITDCDGCRSETGRLFSGCAQCGIRTCTIDRKLSTCASCADYACEILLKHFEADPDARDRLENFRDANEYSH
jgi:hypothetical protein